MCTFITNQNTYQITHEINSNSFSHQILLTEKQNTKLQLIIKDYHLDELTNEEYDLIKDEIVANKMLMHTNLMKFTECFVKNDHLWCIMPFFSYGSLTNILESAFPKILLESIGVKILYDIDKALVYMHNRNLIHRNVCSDNIYVSSRGTAHLAGLRYTITMYSQQEKRAVKVYDYPNTSSQNLILCASPEFLAQDLRGYDQKTDIYSLGLVACQMLNSIIPFSDMENTQILLEKIGGNLPTVLRDQNNRSNIVKDAINNVKAKFTNLLLGHYQSPNGNNYNDHYINEPDDNNDIIMHNQVQYVLPGPRLSYVNIYNNGDNSNRILISSHNKKIAFKTTKTDPHINNVVGHNIYEQRKFSIIPSAALLGEPNSTRIFIKKGSLVPSIKSNTNQISAPIFDLHHLNDSIGSAVTEGSSSQGGGFPSDPFKLGINSSKDPNAIDLSMTDHSETLDAFARELSRRKFSEDLSIGSSTGGSNQHPNVIRRAVIPFRADILRRNSLIKFYKFNQSNADNGNEHGPSQSITLPGFHRAIVPGAAHENEYFDDDTSIERSTSQSPSPVPSSNLTSLKNAKHGQSSIDIVKHKEPCIPTTKQLNIVEKESSTTDLSIKNSTTSSQLVVIDSHLANGLQMTPSLSYAGSPIITHITTTTQNKRGNISNLSEVGPVNLNSESTKAIIPLSPDATNISSFDIDRKPCQKPRLSSSIIVVPSVSDINEEIESLKSSNPAINASESVSYTPSNEGILKKNRRLRFFHVTKIANGMNSGPLSEADPESLPSPPVIPKKSIGAIDNNRANTEGAYVKTSQPSKISIPSSPDTLKHFGSIGPGRKSIFHKFPFSWYPWRKHSDEAVHTSDIFKRKRYKSMFVGHASHTAAKPNSRFKIDDNDKHPNKTNTLPKRYSIDSSAIRSTRSASHPNSPHDINFNNLRLKKRSSLATPVISPERNFELQPLNARRYSQHPRRRSTLAAFLAARLTPSNVDYKSAINLKSFALLCLKFDPEERPSAEAILTLPIFKKVHRFRPELLSEIKTLANTNSWSDAHTIQRSKSPAESWKF